MRNMDLPLLQFKQVVATPHIGYVTHENLATQFSDSRPDCCFAGGKPINAVNLDVVMAAGSRG